MAGYLPSFFFCLFMDLDFVSVHKHARKERGQYPAILNEQSWSIKDLLYAIKHQNMINFPCRTKPVSRAGKVAPSCPLGDQSQREIRFILPAYTHGASHIIKFDIYQQIFIMLAVFINLLKYS